MKERDVSLENDLMMLGQEPMDEPDSSTTIELQRVVKETERKMLKPPAPPVEAEKKNVPKPVEPKNDPTVKTEPKAKTETVSTKEPKTYRPTIPHKQSNPRRPSPIPMLPSNTIATAIGASSWPESPSSAFSWR